MPEVQGSSPLLCCKHELGQLEGTFVWVSITHKVGLHPFANLHRLHTKTWRREPRQRVQAFSLKGKS